MSENTERRITVNIDAEDIDRARSSCEWFLKAAKHSLGVVGNGLPEHVSNTMNELQVHAQTVLNAINDATPDEDGGIVIVVNVDEAHAIGTIASTYYTFEDKMNLDE